MPFPLPMGGKVRVIESPLTSNWTRIDTGRTAKVVGYQAYSFRHEAGPRVNVLAVFDDVAKWDTRVGEPCYFPPCRLELISA